MLSEKELIDRLKKGGFLPPSAPDVFSKVVGTVKWNEEGVAEIFKSLGFEFYPNVPSVDFSLMSKLPPHFLRKERVIPVSESDFEILAVTDNPFNYEGIKKLEWMLGKPVKVAVVPFDEINEFLSSLTEVEEKEEIEESQEEDILTSTDEAPIVQLVNDLLMSAV